MTTSSSARRSLRAPRPACRADSCSSSSIVAKGSVRFLETSPGNPHQVVADDHQVVDAERGGIAGEIEQGGAGAM